MKKDGRALIPAVCMPRNQALRFSGWGVYNRAGRKLKTENSTAKQKSRDLSSGGCCSCVLRGTGSSFAASF